MRAYCSNRQRDVDALCALDSITHRRCAGLVLAGGHPQLLLTSATRVITAPSQLPSGWADKFASFGADMLESRLYSLAIPAF